MHFFAPFFNLKISAKNRQHFFAIEIIEYWFSEFFQFMPRILHFFCELTIFDEFLSGFRDKFQKRVTCVFFSIKFAAKSEKKFIKNRRKMQNSTEKMKKIGIQLFNREKMLTIFGWNFKIEERCKEMHCVDLGESFPTSIYLQKLASIQPSTSLVKFARSPRTDPPGL